MSGPLARLSACGLRFRIAARSVALLQPAPVGAPARVLGPAGGRDRPAVSSAPSGDRRQASAAAVGVLALTLAAAVAAFAAPQPARALLIFAAMVTVPGAAVMLRVSGTDATTAAGLTVAISLAIGTLASLAMVWTGWWHPVAGAAAVGTASVLSILPLCRGRLRVPWAAWRPGVGAVAVLPAALALVLWVTSLNSGADLVHLRGIGLPAGLAPPGTARSRLPLRARSLSCPARNPTDG